jgi:transcriptional regulator with XRE-family HTH domain
MRELSILFGQRLYQIRQRKNFTRKQLASAIGVSEKFIGMIERGESGASFETLAKLSEVLEVRVYSLFDFQELK